ncbi:unnamed protein product [Linum trigynum]|uniref:Uncharacterized protein n=1 Tax=Linum trigynum TaxID=586398 RepID=A0AAV2DXE4_9ROSI
MSKLPSPGAPSGDAPPNEGQAPDVIKLLEKHFSPDPNQESGGWTPRGSKEAPAKDAVLLQWRRLAVLVGKH